jgi:methylenetetrahydrofolate reductase (NADPH)
MQVIRLAKAVAAGTQFIITQPVYDIDRFEAWWSEVTRRGLQEKVAIIAGIRPLPDAEVAQAYAGRRPSPMVPEALVQRISAPSGKSAQRAVGLEIALEIHKRLSSLKGLRGFEVRGDGDADIALEFIEKTGLGIN